MKMKKMKIKGIVFLNLLFILSQILAEEFTTQVCEGDTFSASCEIDQVLAIESANYGRTNSSVCKPNKENNCKLKETVALLNKQCFGKRECTLTVSDEIFGDPCPKIPKYLDVTYTCTSVDNVLEACKKYSTNLDKANGYIKSTNYPSNYNENQDCVISLKSRKGHRYDISLLDLDVENRSGRGCYDWLIIRDGNNEANHFSFCGKYGDIHTEEPEKMEQLDNVIITFTSDGMTSRGGFIIKYTEVKEKMRHEEF